MHSWEFLEQQVTDGDFNSSTVEADTIIGFLDSGAETFIALIASICEESIWMFGAHHFRSKFTIIEEVHKLVLGS
ncbi:hypothetical protein CASFOL_024944 [Castilleja foliolosa]|uniref:Uncharacterized protein n=1 Tax=Castilleja foliolosa TaxID=1961234 RepID=A0ABD3CTH0_9LAMI